MAPKGEKQTYSEKKNSKFKGKKRKFNHQKKFSGKQKKWELENSEIEKLKEEYDKIDTSKINTFNDFPLSTKTKKGLKFGEFKTPTEIQRESVGLALQGNDILGAAKTGSGKTLAFLIPVMECLNQLKWTSMDGLGALIITPTRELAYQIFEVLRKIGRFHDFSAGLVIGGKHLREEAERINNTNIVICTPGRLLQHMDETVHFNADNLQVLVLDEADRILDMGFQQSMNAIIENLPAKRQTLLFSATQTKSVKDLARLSLQDPMYVSVHENAKHSTPVQLQQSYIVCELDEKMDVLWSFIKNHLKSKVLVFIQSCKQVRYIHETIRQLRPGTTVLALHGAMMQLKRVSVYEQFCRKQNAILFATDIAARGLDFPAVNWVVQLDCPEDANTYIHRAGRTARYEKNGESLLILLPSEEEGMKKQLDEKKIPINKIRINQKRLWSIQPKMESLCASEVQHKEFAQRAFMSYLKSVYLMKNKSVFDIKKIDTEKYARSLGLAIAPRIRFLQKEEKRQAETVAKKKANDILMAAKSRADNMGKKGKANDSGVEESSSEEEDDSEEESEEGGKTNKAAENSEESSDEDSDDSEDEENSENDTSNKRTSLSEKKVKTKATNDSDKTKKSKPKSESKTETFNFSVEGEEEENDDFLTVKKSNTTHSKLMGDSSTDSEDSELENIIDSSKKKEKALSKYALAKKLQKKKIVVNTKVVFDEEGKEVKDVHKKPQADVDEEDSEGGINLEAARRKMQKEDEFDKQLYREKIKQRHKEQRIKEKEARRKAKKKQESDEDEMEAILDTDSAGFNIDDLPDPDRSRSDDDSEDGSGDDSGDDSEDEDRPPKKKQRQESSSDEDENDEDDESDENEEDSESDDQDNFDTGLSLEDDEALALKLLTG